MELRDLQFISRVAEFGSVTRAARELGIDPSTLSRHVAALEEELGVVLFERGHNGVRTTSAGQDVIRLARRAMDDVDAIRHFAARSSLALVGELRLATQSASLGPKLRPPVALWRAQHPKVAFELIEAEDGAALTGLRERRIDTAIVYAPAPAADLAFQSLWDERLMAAVPKRHSLATRRSLSWADLRDNKILIRGSGGSEVLRRIKVDLLGPDADVRLHHSGSLDVLNLVAIGEGLALMCENHREIVFPGVRYVDIDEPDARATVALAWRPELEDAVVGSFVALMRDWARDRRAHANGGASQMPDRLP